MLVHDVEAPEQVLSMSPDSVKAVLCSYVATELLSKYDSAGSIFDLDRAVATHELAIEHTSADDSNRLGLLSKFTIVLHKRFKQTGYMNDLNCAIVVNSEMFSSER